MRVKFKKCIFATQRVGDKPDWDEMLQPEAKQLLSNVTYYLETSDRWILNIDLDYFFCAFPDDKRELMFSKEYIRSLFKEFHNAWEKGKFSSVTVCLSPDEGYSGSWENAQRVLDIFTEVFNVPLTLG